MRIIEPTRRIKNKKSNKKLIYFCILVIFLGIFGYYKIKNLKSDKVVKNDTNNVLAQKNEKKIISDPSPEDLKNFTGQDFQTLYNSIIYPNTKLIRSTPIITGNQQADERIITIAKSRGYDMRSVPVALIDKVNTVDTSSPELLQPLAKDAWLKIKHLADSDGIPLKLNSGYRSIEDQRQLFLERLSATGASFRQIADGQADNQVVSVLTQAAIPGFSRHHTGFTVDFICANGEQSFKTTTCFKWLKDNNYYNAKRFGWIPSYPEGSNEQGPEPEPWEYVWVGAQSLQKD